MQCKRVASLIGALTLAAAAPCHPQGRTGSEERFFDWTNLRFPATEYSARRQSLMAALQEEGGGVFLAPSSYAVRGMTFRQLDDFLYFTGLELPNSILAIDADSGAVMVFAPRRDDRFENPSRPNDFPGRRLADDPDLERVSGIAEVRSSGDLESFLASLAAAARPVWIRLPTSGSVQPLETEPINQWNAEQALLFHIQGEYPAARVRNAYDAVARLRMIKSAAELAVMRAAAEITERAILAAARFVRAGVDERTLEAEFEAGCKRGGSQRLAFPSIIKSGPNSLWPWRILASHYDRRNRTMHDGELVIFDVGCELDHYASDMGRTFPISGEFTAEQRRLLQMITVVSDSIIAAIRPGITLAELNEIGVAQIPPQERRFMQTGLYYGHHIGLASGDPSLPDVPLEQGMVFTVEPWYYNHERGVAVFIEDNVLVTSTGVEVLTTTLPRTPEELQQLVMLGRN